MKPHGDGYILSTGREFDDAAGGIGIDHNLEVYKGHDSMIDTDADWNDDPWSPEEKAELADYMIGLWQKYKDAAYAKA